MSAILDSRRAGQDPHYRRGIYLLPSLFTIGNMFCGYASIVHAMWGEFAIAALYVGIAFVLDSLDGRIARYTNTHERVRRRARLAGGCHLVRHGARRARVLVGPHGSRAVGLGERLHLRRRGGAAPRALQHPVDHADRQALLRRDAVAVSRRGRRRHRLRAGPSGSPGRPQALAAVVVLLVPAFLMVSTVRFRAFKAVNFGWARLPMPLFLFAILIVFIFTEPRFALVVLAYGYLISALVEWGLTRMRTRRPAAPPAAPPSP